MALQRVGLSLLLGGAGLAVLAIAWLIVFSVTGGAAPTPVAPGAPPVAALVLMGVGGAAVVVGYVLAIVVRVRREHDVAARTFEGRGSAGSAVAVAIAGRTPVGSRRTGAASSSVRRSVCR